MKKLFILLTVLILSMHLYAMVYKAQSYTNGTLKILETEGVMMEQQNNNQ